MSYMCGCLYDDCVYLALSALKRTHHDQGIIYAHIDPYSNTYQTTRKTGKSHRQSSIQSSSNANGSRHLFTGALKNLRESMESFLADEVVGSKDRKLSLARQAQVIWWCVEPGFVSWVVTGVGWRCTKARGERDRSRADIRQV